MGIDAWEVSQAAASKPFGYLPFRPGPGIGGHCIPVNPYYLLSTCSMPILEHATTTSWQRPAHVAQRFMETVLRERQYKSSTHIVSKQPRALVVGVGFKRGQSVMSNSPGAAIIREMLSEGDFYVEFADPLVSADALPYAPKMDTPTQWNEDYLSTFDGIIVAVDQVGLDMAILNQIQGVTVHDYSGRREGGLFGVTSALLGAGLDQAKLSDQAKLFAS
jgi:UDP-N-acetyl-D-mannosaminuronate dehydrogenase